MQLCLQVAHHQRLRRCGLGFLLLTLGCVAGCSRPDSNGVEIRSSIFSKVEVIGGRGSALGRFNKPRSVAVDRNDNLYVVDMTGRVQKFSPQGAFLLSWQLPQTDLGKPKGMATDTNGNIIVVEPHYQRVNHFAPDGSLASQWGRRGTNAGELVLPRAVAVNSQGDLFLSEYTTVDRVQAFRAGSHAPFLLFGRPGASDGEFNRAEGMGFDNQDRLYVADSCNHRIQIFSGDGTWLKTFGRPGRSSGELSYPYDVRVDREGRQFVCEFGNSRIQVFDAQNRPLEILGGPGTRPGQFNNPWSIALDSQGNLYVADAGNHRVQKFVK
jgi:DNA-binding beta-propeller fold protein YncE